MTNKYALLFATTLLSGCSLAPELKDVLPALPGQYKEARPADLLSSFNTVPGAVTSSFGGVEGAEMAPTPAAEDWKKAEPSDNAHRGEWWKIFNDPALDELEKQATEANQSLMAAAARVTQGRAQAEFESAGLFPDISALLGGNRSSSTNANFPGGGTGRIKAYNYYQAKGIVSYELDLFGQERSRSNAADYLAESQEATYRSTLLALQADVAQTYFTLRALDEEIRTLKGTVAVREQAEGVMKKRFDAGFTGELDYARAQSDLASVRADLAGLEKMRAATEHALAILLGKAPAEFSFADSPLAGDIVPPEIPAGLPSSLLERRPDIAAAQRVMASKNERIGFARAAFFPSISLNASGGYESNKFKDVFRWASRTWALGPTVDIPIFSGNSNLHYLDRTWAEYDEAVANYRQQVLVAFREVEDGLSGTRLLAEQQNAQITAAATSRRVAELADKRYDQGDLNYLDVVDAKRSQLAAERALAQIKGQRYIATISLIRALGGGW